MAARCTTPPAAMHHFTGMDAPFARNQCTTFCGHTVLLGRCMHESMEYFYAAEKELQQQRERIRMLENILTENAIPIPEEN